MTRKQSVRGGIRAGLLLLALAGCDERKEAPEPEPSGPRRASLAGSCEARPPSASSFEPELEWAWTGSPVMPEHVNVRMTPVVVDTNADGVPDVIFNSYAGGNYVSNGVLRVVDGATGQDLWAVTDPRYRVRGASSIAAADIDADGRVEICTTAEDSRGLLCFEHDGSFKFRTDRPGNNWGGPSLADLDHDGRAEIINGHGVFGSDGGIQWEGGDGVGGTTHGPISFAVDIDQDGELEVINDRAVYRADGGLKCSSPEAGHGLAGVANFDADPYGEVVVVSSGRVSLMDVTPVDSRYDKCALKWVTPLPGGGSGGAPTIADVDGDGAPEIGVAGANAYTVFETDGTVKWTSPIFDYSFSRTGSSAFDFEGDGRAEIIYADEQRLRIYDGTTGEVRFESAHSACTAYQMPVVADVDGDNNAELLVAQNNNCVQDRSAEVFSGLRLYRERRDGWVNTRRIWNQHAFAITHVNEDGTLPATPLTPWLHGFNSFRANSQGSPGTSAFAAPDARIVSDLTTTCDPASWALTLRAKVRNTGDAAASRGLRVAFYQGDPSAGGTLLGVSSLGDTLAPGGEASALLTLFTPPGGRARVWAVADDDGTGPAKGGRERECDEGNNAFSTPLSLQCASSTSATWAPTGRMQSPRLMHTSTLLEDGRVLVVGGFTPQSELYQPTSGTWSAGGAALTPHRAHTATRLADGRVLVVGGWQDSSSRVNAELYTPASGTWRAAGVLNKLRYHHTATLLPDGRVLVVGGTEGEYASRPFDSAELYDPASDTWSAAGTLGTARKNHTATLLPGGRVLIAGGLDGAGAALASAEVFDPTTRAFAPARAARTGHGGHSATLLPSGRVLVVGGQTSDATQAWRGELYDPATDTWRSTGLVRLLRREHIATLLSNGKVLVAGGYHPSSGILAAAELYDPASDTWSDAAPMTVDRYRAAATPLLDGTVLVTGGSSNRDSFSAELYTP